MNYINELYSAADNRATAVNSNNKQTRWFPVTELDQAAEYMVEAGKHQSVYFGWGLQEQQLTSGERGKSETVCAIPGIMMDIDLRSSEGAHATDSFPVSREEFDSFMAEIDLLKPTAVRNSGNGLYAEWLLRTLWKLASEEERSRAAGLSSRLQKAIIAIAREKRGWSLDYC